MSINDYRRQLEKKVQTARASLPRKRRRGTAMPLTVSGVLDRKTAHEPLLQQLADQKAPPKQRLDALQTLKGLVMASPTSEQWQPRFTEALRSACEEPKVRRAALSALVEMGDARTRERLLAGLKDESAAMVSKGEAFDLLANDEHGDAIEAARQAVDDPETDEEAKTAALPLLARDTKSVDRLRGAIGDKHASRNQRQTAVDSLYALDKKALTKAKRSVSDNAQLKKHVEGLLNPLESAEPGKPRRRRR